MDGLTLKVVGAQVIADLANGNGDSVLKAQMGLDLPPEIGVTVIDCSTESSICFYWGNTARIEVAKSADDVCYDVKWETTRLKSNRDCFEIGNEEEVVWFGGAEEFEQHFPLRKDNPRAEVAYLPGDMLQESENSPLPSSVFKTP